jgi:hypothetical protein
VGTRLLGAKDGAGGVTDRLPELLDCRGIMRETGLTRATAEKLMRHVPIVKMEDSRKVLVRRADVLAYLDARTFAKDQVPA